MTSLQHIYKDRFGKEHYTVEGLRWVAQQAIAAFGYITIDSFQDGATLTLPNEVLRWKLPDGDGEYYRWDGELPKVVPADSTPESAGGIGTGKWLSVGDAILRTDLAKEDGATLIGGSAYVVDYFSDAMNSSAGGAKIIMTRGHHIIGVGAATYVRDGTAGEPSTGNELKFYDAAGNGWKYQSNDGKYDVDAFGLIADDNEEGANNVDKLQSMLDITGRADFISSGQYYFDKFYDNLPNTDKCAIILKRKCEIYTYNDSELRLVGDVTQPTLYAKSLFGATYDGAASGSIFKCKVFIDGQGLFGIFRYVSKLRFEIYTHGANLPPNITPTSAGFGVHVVLWGCVGFVFDNCKMFAANDATDFTTPAIQNAEFGIRVLTSWLSDAVRGAGDGVIRNSEFHGFTYNATEVAGPTTRNVLVHDNVYYDCCLTPLDFDKGCQDCHGYNNTIIRPRKGLHSPGVGGDQWIAMRIQGFTDGEAINITGFGCSLKDNLVIDAGGKNDSSNTFVYCTVDRQDSAVVSGNRQRNSLALRGVWITNSKNTTVSGNKLYAIDFMNYTSMNTDNLIVNNNDVDVTRYALNTGVTGNGFASMIRMLWVNNNFRYVDSASGMMSEFDGIYVRENKSICTGVFLANTFTGFNRAYTTQENAGNKVTFKSNVAVNCRNDPVIADVATQSVEFTAVSGY